MRTVVFKFVLKVIVLALMLIGFPLLGVSLTGRVLAPYLEFPPLTRYVQHAPFSWLAFISLSVVIVAVIGGLFLKVFKNRPFNDISSDTQVERSFPWWGWLGTLWLAVAWTLAWTRFEWMAPVQAHTFTPLWFAYIIVVNAICQKRTGRCLMLDRPLFFLLLFPLSALFWWFFEFLNRFVQNWYYIGPQFSPLSYFWYATLPFSTVLPAVLSTAGWINRADWIQDRFKLFPPAAPLRSGWLAIVILMAAGAGLILIGILPNLLFPLLWIAPLLIVCALQTLMGEHQVFAEMATGDWRRAIAAATAALVCGFFWEMWNLHSLAKWKYSIPLVHRFSIFEMPILGYAGYLPFGLECLVIGDILKGFLEPGDPSRS